MLRLELSPVLGFHDMAALPLPAGQPLVLRVLDQGADALEPSTPGRPPANAVARLLATTDRRGEPSGVLVLPLVPDLLVNGLTPLSFKVLAPGDVLSASGRDWMLVSRYTPVVQEAPEEVAAAACPVCGMELRVARVCAHPCGTSYHLENPEGKGNSETELNCFLSIPSCHTCGEAMTLEDHLVPDPDPWMERRP